MPALVRTPVIALSGDVVIDTNVWLDLLVFDDPRSRAIRRDIEQQACQVITCHRARAELADVLRRPKFIKHAHDPVQCLAQFDQWVVLHADPPRCALRSTDPDDQIFIDLAVQRRSRYLLSRDKALLTLARRAESDYQVLIRVPDALAFGGAGGEDKGDDAIGEAGDIPAESSNLKRRD